MQVKKRNGNLEPLNIDKIHKVVAWATENLSGVSASEVELKSKIQFHDKITTVTIHETIIKAAAELISEECPNYQYVAGRLINYHIRKIVYGQYEPIPLYKLIQRNIASGFYDKSLLEDYTEAEWTKINSFVDHNRDMSLTYAAMEQLRGKYLVQNRVTKTVMETPQVVYALVAATLFARYPAETRMSYVRDYYDAISKHDISLPTPIMAGVRTPQRQFSSCVVLETGDALSSISATSAAIVSYVSQKAGIGIGAGRIRALGSAVRNGDTSHTGVTPFYKLFQTAVSSCCLTPDMLVEIDQSEPKKIKIKDLRVGDLIKSYDPITKSVTFKEVTDVWNTIVPNEQQVRLEFTNRCVINCSENHPIMVLHNGNVIEKKPKDLTDYDSIISDDNKIVYLYDIQVGANNDESYIDITVAETNTFFTQQNSNSAMILTHNSQGSVRQGSATLFFAIFHLEIEDMLVLKNNKGTEDNRVRRLDYGVQFCKLFYERLITGGDITLFSPHDIPEAYEAFFNDQVKFKQLYEAAEKNPKIRKKVVKAIDLFSAFVQERKDTGRIYLQNVDHSNTHSSFIESMAPIRQSNLCLAGDTMITVRLSDNSVKKIRLDEVGLTTLNGCEILSHDVLTGETNFKEIVYFAKMSPLAKVMKIIDTGTGRYIICTRSHLVYTSNRGYVLAVEIAPEDEIFYSDAELQSLSSKLLIEQLNENQEVYDVTVQDNHNFFANDILVHNCMEITLPTVPMGSTETTKEHVQITKIVEFLQSLPSQDKVIKNTMTSDEEGFVDFEIEQDLSRISLCTLSAINWGNIKQPSDFERPCRLAVRALDELLSYQNYPVKAAERSTMEFRPLGVGIINLAYWLAKNDLKYSDNSALSKIDEYTEAWSYYLIKASVDLAKEKGACLASHKTKYAQGIMPIDTRKIDIDGLVPHIERMPWDQLREDAKKYGIRNATLLALMPSETSSILANATNGIEPPRAFVSVKQSKDGVLKQVVPGFPRLKNKYDLLWDQKSPEGYLNICAVLQKYIDQAISVNTSYNPKFYPDEKVPMSELLKHILQFYKYGGKNLYYNQTMDGQGEIDIDKMMNNSIKSVSSSDQDDEEDCESCKL